MEFHGRPGRVAGEASCHAPAAALPSPCRRSLRLPRRLCRRFAAPVDSWRAPDDLHTNVYDPELDAVVAERWPQAQAHWSRFLLLQPARTTIRRRPRIAQIDLATRRIGLHYRLDPREEPAGLRRGDSSLTRSAITSAIPARSPFRPGCACWRKPLLPLDNYSLMNLFTDLLINDALRPALEEQLAARLPGVRRRSDDRSATRPSSFTWPSTRSASGLEPGSLMGPCHEEFGEGVSQLPGRGAGAGTEPVPSGAEPLHPVPLLRVRDQPLCPARVTGGFPARRWTVLTAAAASRRRTTGPTP